MVQYIHARTDWPRFRWDDAFLAAPLADVRYRQGRLLGQMEGLGFELPAKAELEALTSEVIKSSEIEGEKLNPAQVRSSLARRLGVEFPGPLPTDRHVEGIVDMMLDATQHCASPLTEPRLLGWHAALFPTGHSGMRRVRVGAWRDDGAGPMQVVSGPFGRERVHFEAPPAQHVPSEMQTFLAWFENDAPMDPVLKAGVAHLWFVTIHPFEDGNGRIARALTDLMLTRSEGGARRFYSMSSQIRTERTQYYAILESTQKGDLDITPWLQWYLTCLGRAISRAQDVVGDVLQQAAFWTRHAGTPINERQRTMLSRLLDGFQGKLTSTKWATITKCSQDTASRDIADLVSKGILRKNEGGGRSTSYSLVEG